MLSTSFSMTWNYLNAEKLFKQRKIITRVRAVPEIILRGGHGFFSDPSTPRTHGVRAPQPPGHVSALTRPTMDQICLDPQDKLLPAPPPPRTHCQQNTLPPQDKKVSAAPPEDNFWNRPNTLTNLTQTSS